VPTDSAPIPFILCFDVEPDEVDVALEAAPWVGFERLVERSTRLRAQLEDQTGRSVRFNWFLRMDPQIALSHGAAGWVAERYAEPLAQLREAGDAFGLHPHASRWIAESGHWLPDHGDAEWVAHCIRTSFDAFEAAMGETCRFVRFGDRFISTAAIRLCADLGARYDLTVEPGAPGMRSMRRGPATGRIVSMEFAPRRPYRPSAVDVLSASTDPAVDVGLWEVPLTALDPDPVLSPLRWVGRRIRHRGRPLHRPASLVAGMWPAEPFWRGVEEFLDVARVRYLAFAVRSDAPIRPAHIGPFEEKLRALASLPIVKRLEFTRPDAVDWSSSAG
jgi:hypothetical protein